jgi:hypothetical protein
MPVGPALLVRVLPGELLPKESRADAKGVGLGAKGCPLHDVHPFWEESCFCVTAAANRNVVARARMLFETV